MLSRGRVYRFGWRANEAVDRVTSHRYRRASRGEIARQFGRSRSTCRADFRGLSRRPREVGRCLAQEAHTRSPPESISGEKFRPFISLLLLFLPPSPSGRSFGLPLPSTGDRNGPKIYAVRYTGIRRAIVSTHSQIIYHVVSIMNSYCNDDDNNIIFTVVGGKSTLEILYTSPEQKKKTVDEIHFHSIGINVKGGGGLKRSL